MPTASRSTSSCRPRAGLDRLAPEKIGDADRGRDGRDEGRRSPTRSDASRRRFKSAPRFAPAGQSTQMIVGADAATDGEIIDRASRLYDRFGLRRVYYSAFSPIPDASAVLPLQRPPLMREHRLYQSDWLMRFYGFAPAEVVAAAGDDGMLPLDIDPKLAWALKFRDRFPVDVNRAPEGACCACRGSASRRSSAILSSRRWRRLRLDDVAPADARRSPRCGRSSSPPTGARPLLADRADLRTAGRAKREQLELFAA